MRSDIKDIINRASHDTKEDYRIYNIYKQELMDLNLSNEEYAEAITMLVEVMEV